MKIKLKIPKVGETRFIKKFALFPHITNDGYKVWLEHYFVKQKAVYCIYDYEYYSHYDQLPNWINKKDKDQIAQLDIVWFNTGLTLCKTSNYTKI